MAMTSFPDIFPAGRDLLSDGVHALDHAALAQRIATIEAALAARTAPGAPVAILADNSPDWLAVDLATQQAGLTLVPLPLFFTPAQWGHVIAASGAQALFCADPAQGAALGFTEFVGHGGALALCQRPGALAAAGAAELAGVQKITFTSGTTAAPKGVCLGSAQQWEVAQALHAGLGRLGVERHLCLLPFAVLLENIAGPYTALLSGATTICPPLAEVGLSGASGFDAQRCLDAIARYQAHSVILLPQMLAALLAASAPGDPRLASLRFAAVGGARTPARVLAAARARGIPVFEGYGLSECSSVVALNLPGAARDGSVGRPLAHRAVRIASDGEIEVRCAAPHYLGQPRAGGDWLATGDLGRLDGDGYLFIEGRKKDILITGYGRNVSPEWPESALLGTGLVAQALVLGDGQPWLGALLVPAGAAVTPEQLQRAVDLANRDLPDYARVRRWAAVAPFTPADGLLTANGRPRRAAIAQRHADRIASLFDQTEHAS